MKTQGRYLHLSVIISRHNIRSSDWYRISFTLEYFRFFSSLLRPRTHCRSQRPRGLWVRATLEPEPTQHSKPTFVWVYIAGTYGYILAPEFYM